MITKCRAIAFELKRTNYADQRLPSAPIYNSRIKYSLVKSQLSQINRTVFYTVYRLTFPNNDILTMANDNIGLEQKELKISESEYNEITYFKYISYFF